MRISGQRADLTDNMCAPDRFWFNIRRMQGSCIACVMACVVFLHIGAILAASVGWEATIRHFFRQIHSCLRSNFLRIFRRNEMNVLNIILLSG